MERWGVAALSLVDLGGLAVPVKVERGRVSRAISDTPVFVEPSE
jgi:hypothetical protein